MATGVCLPGCEPIYPVAEVLMCCSCMFPCLPSCSPLGMQHWKGPACRPRALIRCAVRPSSGLFLPTLRVLLIAVDSHGIWIVVLLDIRLMLLTSPGGPQQQAEGDRRGLEVTQSTSDANKVHQSLPMCPPLSLPFLGDVVISRNSQ